MSIRFVTVVTCWAILGTATVLAEAPYQITWSRQLGTNNRDYGNSVAVDAAGNSYITGYSNGAFNGSSEGLTDAFLSKYDVSGTLLWTKQLGTSSYDESYSVAVDATGNAFITGRTRGDLGGPNQGDFDAFLSKYDASGTRLWTKQLGTSDYDVSFAVTVEASGNAFITGLTEGPLAGLNQGSQDAFLMKYDASGTLLWKNQLGTGGTDFSSSVAVDASGNAFISGCTGGLLGSSQYGGFDAFLSKYDASGTFLWTKQLGTSAYDESLSVAVDASGNAFITGRSVDPSVARHTGNSVAFLSKCDASGELLWTRTLGTSANCNEGLSVTVDASGNALISGFTDGNLGGPNLGGADVLLNKYDASGTLLWSEQLGTSRDDIGNSVAVDASGNVFIGGTVTIWHPYPGSPPGLPNPPGYYDTDVFLYKLSSVPEPGCITLLLAGAICLLAYAWQQRKRQA